MSLQRCLDDHELCLRAASEVLGETACAIELRWDCEQLLRPRLRFEFRRGVRAEGPMLAFDTERPGHELAAGIERYRVDYGDRSLRVARVYVPFGSYPESTYYDFWAVGQTRYRDFYRVLRQLERQEMAAPAPLMRAGDAERLYTNTIGFLRRGCQTLREHGVPQRRGVLLLGQPGNGKTMACRWIRSECGRRGLCCRNVSAEEFSSALCDGRAHTLFQLSRPGVIFFDDFDSALRDRETNGTTTERTLFLNGLDGIDVHVGVVYVFTSNARLDEIDPAVRRPGRVDVILTFGPPATELRRALITTRWHADLRRQLPIERIVRQTEGMSFAELEELKKLLVLQLIDFGRCDWDQAYSDFHAGRADKRPKSILGFAAQAPFPVEPSVPQTSASFAHRKHLSQG
ncbi:MAG: ATP-binding protein [Planctomycetes bacterium]|nr:ATP-binding protein [Planctomycetota bacterium]MBL7038568.1 ATP-binding protein [Pirellulaceae bacterium]